MAREIVGLGDDLRLDYTNDVVDRVESVELLESGVQLTRLRQAPRFVAYRDIALVRLRYAPMRAMPENFVCIIESRWGDRMRFGSLSQTGGFPNPYRPVPYRAFVEELHKRILAAGGQTQFHGGDTAGGFGLRLVGTIVAIGVAIGILAFDKSLPTWALMPLAILFAWWGWPLIRNLQANETRTYDPRFIPTNLLPRDTA